MLKKLTLVLVVSSFLGTGACTSKKEASDEASDADMAEMTAEDSAASDAAETADAADPTDETAASDDLSADLGSDGLSADEALPEDKAAGGGTEDQLAADDLKPDEFADTPPSDLAQSELKPEPLMEEPAPAPAPAPEPMPEPESMAANDVPPPSLDSGFSEEPKPMAPLRKIADAPYKQSGILLNTVYLAREGDSLETISKKIYGTDKTKQLLKANPRYEAKDVKVGDKVYYNSPNRPTDDTKMMTFYEDIGLSPLVYVTKPGDNIRNLGKSLLGNESSWKELYSTNMNVESKGDLPEGIELRYWANADVGSSAPPQELAESTPPPPPAETLPPPVEEPPAPPPQEMANNAPPPAESMEPPPPPPSEEPPPPPAAATVEPPLPPPPPAPPAPDQGAGSSAVSALQDPDQQMALGMGAVLLLAAVALLIVIQKKKRARRQLDFNTSTQTQIE